MNADFKNNKQKDTIDFIIVNWNKAQTTVELLSNLLKLETEGCNFIVVDNASDKIDWLVLNAGLADYAPMVIKSSDINSVINIALPKVTIIRSNNNTGYAGGNNMGFRLAIRLSSNPYVWILNNDMEIKSEGVIRNVRKVLAARSSERIVCSPPIMTPDGIIRLQTRKLNLLGLYKTKKVKESVYRSEPHSTLPTDHLQGCSIICHKQVLLLVGFFDERFFLYNEETDWLNRCKSAGIGIFLILMDPIYHDDIFKHEMAPYKVYYKTRNSILLTIKHGTDKFSKKFFVVGRVLYLLYLTILIAFNSRVERIECFKAMVAGLADGFRGRFGIRKWDS